MYTVEIIHMYMYTAVCESRHAILTLFRYKPSGCLYQWCPTVLNHSVVITRRHVVDIDDCENDLMGEIN